MTDTTFIQNIPFDAYFADSMSGLYLTSHSLYDFRTCPLLYRQKMDGDAVIEDTAAFQTGRAVHSLVLGGQEAFDAEYLVSAGPINPKTGEPFGKLTKAFKDWASEQTKKIVLANEYEFMVKLRDSVWSHPCAAELLDGCITEGTVRVTYNGEPVQARMDAINPNTDAVVDLKTCDNIDYFRNDCFRYGYADQMAFYQEVLRIASGVSPSMWLVAVEKRVPYRCGVWRISDALLEKAKAANERGIEELKVCRANGVWPTRYEDIRVLDESESMTI